MVRLPPDLNAIAAACQRDPEHLIGLVGDLVLAHGHASASVLNLVASHNRMSPAATAMMGTNLVENIMSGRRGEREHAGAQFVDAIDEIVVQLCRRLYHAQAVEYRPMSGAIANGLALVALTRPGDTLMALPARVGGHTSYRERGYAGARGLRVVDLPCRTDGSIDVGALSTAVRRERPRAIMVGTAWMLQPLPIAELRNAADEVGALVIYDGAHVLGLIAGGAFQDPLGEGAHVLTGSTQKTLGGPIGGLILSASPEHGELIRTATSGLISNYHNDRIAALAVTLAEFATFGTSFAAAIVDNARRLGSALAERGVPMEGALPHFTESHVLLIDSTKVLDGETGFRRLEDAGILTTKIPLANTYPERRAIRLGTPAITRSGMRGEDMERVAELVARVLVAGEAPASVAPDTRRLAERFQGVVFCFESAGRDELRSASARP